MCVYVYTLCFSSVNDVPGYGRAVIEGGIHKMVTVCGRIVYGT